MTERSPSLVPVDDPLVEIIAHLGAALMQSEPKDDPIIIDHVRTAHQLALDLKRDKSLLLAESR